LPDKKVYRRKRTRELSEPRRRLRKKVYRKNVCAYCHRIIRGLPYQCRRCGRTFCANHRLPEGHKCAELRVRREPVKPLKEPLILVPPPPIIPEKPEPSIPEAQPAPIAVTRPTKKPPSTKKRGVMLVTTVLIVGVIIASFFIYYRGLKKKSSISMSISANSVTFGENVYNTVDILSSGSSPPMPTGWVLFQVSSDNVTWDNYDIGTLTNGCCTSNLYSPPAPGNYLFRTVYSGDANYKGSTSQAEALIVNKDRPAADFNYGPTYLSYGSQSDNTIIREFSTIQFNDDSTDRYGTILSWSWNFGDSASSNVKNSSHYYSRYDTYRVSLTVTNDVGESDTVAKNIDIRPWLGEDNESLDVDLGLNSITGHSITLHNNPFAKDPTWTTLMSFLQQDKTEMIPYVDGSFVCADFAVTLHNNAENAGIRAAYVDITLSSGGHAINAFRTTDRGLVFIDDTGQTDGPGYDKQVTLTVGEQYIPTALFSSNVQFLPVGVVDSYWIQW
jgi:PKD repeat protein